MTTTADLERADGALDAVRAEVVVRREGGAPDVRFDPIIDSLLDLLDEVSE